MYVVIYMSFCVKNRFSRKSISPGVKESAHYGFAQVNSRIYNHREKIEDYL